MYRYPVPVPIKPTTLFLWLSTYLKKTKIIIITFFTSKHRRKIFRNWSADYFLRNIFLECFRLSEVPYCSRYEKGTCSRIFLIGTGTVQTRTFIPYVISAVIKISKFKQQNKCHCLKKSNQFLLSFFFGAFE